MSEQKTPERIFLFPADFEYFGGRPLDISGAVEFVPANTATAHKEEAERLRKALADEQKKFQQETLRTSEQAQLLIKFVQLHESEHSPGPWSKGCPRCQLVGEVKALLLKPINAPSEALAGKQKEGM